MSPTGSDDNPGDERAPFRSIARAASAAVPGTTVFVADGTYDETLKTTQSGTSDARIAYVSKNQWAAKIVGGSGDAAWLNSGDYVDIVGFDIAGESGNGLTQGGSWGRIVDNRVYGFPGNCITTANNDYTLHDIDVIANLTYNCGKTSLDHGIYVSHPNGTVSNNISYGNAGLGIHCWHNCNSLTISNNLVFNNDTGGIVIGQGDSPNDGNVDADNFIVANNIAVRNRGDGISEYGATGSNNKFLSNIVFENEEGGVVLQTGTAKDTRTQDPLFVDFKMDGSGDYRLSPSSTAIDAGVGSAAPPVDISGVRRPQGRQVDIGIFEQ